MAVVTVAKILFRQLMDPFSHWRMWALRSDRVLVRECAGTLAKVWRVQQREELVAR